MNINKLALSWSISRGAETFGYNICRLDSRDSGTRYRTCGGGYDMTGTVFGDFLQAEHQKALLDIRCRAYYIVSEKFGFIKNPAGAGDAERLYGMNHDQRNDRVTIDGACGIESVLKIAEAIGLTVERDWDKRKNRGRGELVGFYVYPTEGAAK